MCVCASVCVRGLMVSPWAGPSVQFYLLMLSTGAVSHMGTLIGHIMQKCGVDYVSGRENGHDSAPVNDSAAL